MRAGRGRPSKRDIAGKSGIPHLLGKVIFAISRLLAHAKSARSTCESYRAGELGQEVLIRCWCIGAPGPWGSLLPLRGSGPCHKEGLCTGVQAWGRGSVDPSAGGSSSGGGSDQAAVIDLDLHLGLP